MYCTVHKVSMPVAYILQLQLPVSPLVLRLCRAGAKSSRLPRSNNNRDSPSCGATGARLYYSTYENRILSIFIDTISVAGFRLLTASIGCAAEPPIY